MYHDSDNMIVINEGNNCNLFGSSNIGVFECVTCKVVHDPGCDNLGSPDNPGDGTTCYTRCLTSSS